MAFERRYEGGEPQRVNKWLAQAGVCSRREAEDLIARGAVRIDGEVVSDPGRKISAGQVLVIADPSSGAEAGGKQGGPRVTVMLNKPVGVVSGQAEHGHAPAGRLIRAEHLWGAADVERIRSARLAPVGRLDHDSHGLLLLSSDGVFAKAVIGPDSEMEKEYRVRVAGRIDRQVLVQLRHGLWLDGRELRPARVTQLDDGLLRFVLQEGRNRQIRRMCELVGLMVTDLLRLRVGPLELGDLPESAWRELTESERAALVKAGAPQARRPQDTPPA